MSRPVTEPEDVGPSFIGNSRRLTHPAWGQISLAAVSSGGAGTALYGSDFTHARYVQIQISRSELTRDLSHDWPHSREEIVTVAMSHAQWATFVSSMGVGEGTQCTIESVAGKYMPVTRFGTRVSSSPARVPRPSRGSRVSSRPLRPTCSRTS